MIQSTPFRRLTNVGLWCAMVGTWLCVVGCGRSVDRFLVLHRALTTAYLDVKHPETDGYADETSTTVYFRGTVSNHTRLATGGPSELTLDAEDPSETDRQLVLKYFLPGGKQFPVAIGDNIGLQVFRQTDHTVGDGVGVLLADQTGQVVVAWSDTAHLPPEVTAHLMVVEPTWKLSYQESGREDGFCEEWKDHGVARAEFQVGDPQPRQVEVVPGQSVQFSSPFGNYEFSLLELSAVRRSTCLEPTGNRFSYVLLRKP